MQDHAKYVANARIKPQVGQSAEQASDAAANSSSSKPKAGASQPSGSAAGPGKAAKKKSKVFAIKGGPPGMCRRPVVENVLYVAPRGKDPGGEVLTLSWAVTNANDCTHFELVQVSDDPTQCMSQVVDMEFTDTSHIEYRTGVLPPSATYTWRVSAWNSVGPGPMSHECEHRVVDKRLEALENAQRAAEQLARRIQGAAADLRRALNAARDATVKGHYRAQNEATVALSLALDSARNRGVVDSVLLRDAELVLVRSCASRSGPTCLRSRAMPLLRLCS